MPLQSVRRISAEEVREGRFSIFDVVLPLPGSEVLLPVRSQPLPCTHMSPWCPLSRPRWPQEHRVGELMRSFLEHDGLQEVHSFEKAWTIRDAEGNEVGGGGGDDEAGAGGLGRWPARRGNGTCCGARTGG